MNDWAYEQASRIVKLVRNQAVTEQEARDLIADAIRTGESRGALLAAGETGKLMIQTFDEAFGLNQEKATK